MAAMTRGRLPASVYWRRRALALVVLVGLPLLVIATVAHLVGGGPAQAPRATQAGASTTPSSSAPSESAARTAKKAARAAARAARQAAKQSAADRRAEKAAAAVPQGPCGVGAVSVTPEVPQAVAGRTVPVKLRLRSLSGAACTWRASFATITVKISSGSDDVWASRQCPKLLAAESVVLRADRDVTVTVPWSARRSSEERCTDYNAWAAPGYYHVVAAAFGGEPTDVQFHLLNPATEAARAMADKAARKAAQRAKEQKSADQQKKADEQGKAQQKKAQQKKAGRKGSSQG